MLEVINLSKIYKTKGGADVKALDGVSLKFPEKGMVFLLGKSGSGKSTLLNVCGGLDNPTSGEIVVKGRSSKNFTQSDFDSYRNTFIGFIFQEYNILNEFSVEDNIALALELQGKPKDKAAIAALLEQVDLTGYAKRKPNTLSGGQKQRIAIARALIKSPEIIMADEPTGALDSNTGKQVFDTLKKLSKDKLVIVVSHDREFAEFYGDRVIELKDGKILSDVSKTTEEQIAISDNVTAVGDTICIKSGADLSEKDFAEIKAFLKKADKDVVIASGERDVKTFKEAARITEEGQKEIFRETDETRIEKKTYKPEDGKFIRSKLPMRHAMKIGVSGLKTKPFRLFFTVILCTVAFVMFGLLSTLTFYNGKTTLRETLQNSNLTAVRIEKEYQKHVKNYNNGVLDNEYEYTSEAAFTKDELSKYAAIYGEETFGAVQVNHSLSLKTPSQYWKNDVTYFACLPESHPLRNKLLFNSAYPQDKADEKQICISLYTANAIKECGIHDIEATITSVQDLIGKTITLGGEKFKISGIFETEELPQKYDKLKTENDNSSLSYKLEQELQDGFHLLAFLTEKEFNVQASKNQYYYDDEFSYKYLSLPEERYDEHGGPYYEYPEQPYRNGAYAAISKSAHETYFFKDTQTGLTGNQAVVSGYCLFYHIDSLVNEKRWKLQDNIRTEYIEKLEALNRGDYFNGTYFAPSSIVDDWIYNGAKPDYSDDSELAAIYEDFKKDYAEYRFYENLSEIIMRGEIYDYAAEEWRPITSEEKTLAVKAVKEIVAEANETYYFKCKLFNKQNQTTLGNEQTFEIVGFYIDNSYDQRAYLTDEKAAELWDEQKTSLEWYSEETTAYVRDKNAVYVSIFLPYDKSNAATDQFMKLYEDKKFVNDTRIRLQSTLFENFENVDDMISSMSQVFLYVGLVMAVFAALLLSNFISVSISHKKREIGILRAVGARSLDVFKIFFSESLTITVICIVLSLIGSFVLCGVLNAEITSMIGAAILVFGIASIAVLIGVALLTALIATFLPVWNAARKKPVESIRAL